MMFFVCRVLCVCLQVGMDGIRYQNENPIRRISKKGFRGGVSKTYAMWYQCNHLAV